MVQEPATRCEKWAWRVALLLTDPFFGRRIPKWLKGLPMANLAGTRWAYSVAISVSARWHQQIYSCFGSNKKSVVIMGHGKSGKKNTSGFVKNRSAPGEVGHQVSASCPGSWQGASSGRDPDVAELSLSLPYRPQEYPRIPQVRFSWNDLFFIASHLDLGIDLGSRMLLHSRKFGCEIAFFDRLRTSAISRGWSISGFITHPRCLWGRLKPMARDFVALADTRRVMGKILGGFGGLRYRGHHWLFLGRKYIHHV